MPRPRRFRVDPRRVVHETIEGETILIHLETGTYYSLTGSGPDMWTLLAAGWSDDEVIAEMERRHHEGDVADATRALVRQLVGEELLEDDENAERKPEAVPDAADGEPFVAPALQKYTDMQYFLLLDPVHDVEAAGWPHERSAAEADELSA